MKIQNGKKLIMFLEIIKLSCASDHLVYVDKDMLVLNITTLRIREEIQRNSNTGNFHCDVFEMQFLYVIILFWCYIFSSFIVLAKLLLFLNQQTLKFYC